MKYPPDFGFHQRAGQNQADISWPDFITVIASFGRRSTTTRFLKAWIRQIIGQVCTGFGVHIVKGVRARDHVHMSISVPPPVALSKGMPRIKGRSPCRVQMAFADLRKRYWGRRFWARGYFSTTSGNVTHDIMLPYLELHSKRDATDLSR